MLFDLVFLGIVLWIIGSLMYSTGKEKKGFDWKSFGITMLCLSCCWLIPIAIGLILEFTD